MRRSWSSSICCLIEEAVQQGQEAGTQRTHGTLGLCGGSSLKERLVEQAVSAALVMWMLGAAPGEHGKAA